MLVTEAKLNTAIENAKKANANPEAIAEIMKSNLKKKHQGFSRILVRVNNGYDIIEIDKIIYIQAVDNYSRIILIGNQVYLESKPLNYFEKLLSDKGFWRIHKSFLINNKQLVKVVKETSAYVVMTENFCIPVSSGKRIEFFEKLKNLVCF